MHPDHNIQNLVKNIACIPCLGTIILKCPRELIHPNGRAAKLYLPSEGRFPQKSKSQGRETGTTVNFSSRQHLERLADLGMLTDRLENEMLIERAQSVENLARKNWDQAMNRAQALIEYLSVEDDPYPPEVIDIVSNTKFLPVMVRPDDWQLPWKSDGENDQLESPRLLFSHNLKDLVACTAKILDCSGLQMNFLNSSEKERALNKMGLRSKADINDSTLFQMVAEQLFTIVHEFNTNPHLNKDLVQNICTSIYKHLNDCLQSKSETEQLIERQFSGKRIIWVESGFEFPFRVAFSSKYNCKPYLFELGSDLRKLRLFFEIIGVKDNFDVEDILNAFKELYTQFGRRQLHGDTVELLSRLAQLLWHVLVEKEKSCLEATSDLYLPDRHRYLQPVASLCLDDCDWLRESDSMKFVHDSISPAVAKMLGVSSKRESDFNHMCGIIPFGQRELLTNRIKRLLEAYTFDNSIFKELIQNADDAGATEIKFIKDFRHHKIDKVMSGWDNLQGPALCIYNNKSFTAADMEGIKNIGLGSKEQDTLKTGRYGVGFNVVYHITDVPSFWTRQDDKEDVICVFDPACQYLANISPQNPGVQIRDISRLKQNYPDMFACYLDNCIDMTSPGTLFRLPLRTSAMAELSKIKQTPLEEVQMNEMLEKFQEEIVKCLLFLNNVRTIGIYTVDRHGSLKADYEVSVKMTESDRQEMENVQQAPFTADRNFPTKTNRLGQPATC
ncbi:sacsin-like [Pomacea canaliculata]|uniref:sacsin-like n=1 Tax=Pomacea canaliculata TaxID=400727 RepID=UPI000D72FFB5|nr:sacsin-like [Pomacea canaliculata]